MARSILLVSAACVAAAAFPKVNVTLYSESLCPDCIHFITGAWIDVWNTAGLGGVDGIITWNQVVYGNAQTNGQKITCQHGAEECAMNLLQTCAINHYETNVTAWLPFVHCMETHGSSQRQYAKQCASDAGMDWTVLNTCWTGAQGLQLEIAAGEETAALQPPHQFVPWVTLGNTPGTFCENSNCDTFAAAVCAAYTGPKPAGCAAAMARAATYDAAQVDGTCVNPRA